MLETNTCATIEEDAYIFENLINRLLAAVKPTKRWLKHLESNPVLRLWQPSNEEDGSESSNGQAAQVEKFFAICKQRYNLFVGKPEMTRKHLQKEIEQLSEKINDLRTCQQDQLAEKKPYEQELWALNNRIESQQRAMSGICARARNNYSKTQIVSDFLAGRREMALAARMGAGDGNQIDMDGDEMQEALEEMGEEDEEGEGHPPLDVFTVSSSEFLKLSGKLKRDGGTKTFGEIEETEIPRLRRYIEEISNRRRQASLERMLLSSYQSISAVYAYLSDSGTKSAVTRKRVFNEVQKEKTILEGNLKALASAWKLTLNTSLKEKLEVRLEDGVRQGIEKAQQCIEDYARPYRREDKPNSGLHFSTYRVTTLFPDTFVAMLLCLLFLYPATRIA